MHNLLKRNINSKPDAEATGSNIKECSQESPVTKSADTIERLKEKITVSEGADIVSFAGKFLSLLAREREISQGIYYQSEKEADKNVLKFVSGYAYDKDPADIPEIEFGDGLPGQVALDCKPMIISEVPQDYLSIVSGLGNAAPASIIIFPIIYKKEVMAVVELASFHPFTDEDENLLMELASYLSPQLKKAFAK